MSRIVPFTGLAPRSRLHTSNGQVAHLFGLQHAQLSEHETAKLTTTLFGGINDP